MNRTRLLATLFAACALAGAAEPLPDPAMGDWSADGAPAVQVIPLGKDKYCAHVFTAFAKGEDPIAVLQGTGKDGAVTFTGVPDGQLLEGKKDDPELSWWAAPSGSKDWSGAIANGVFTLHQPGKGAQALKPVDRSSPTIGAKPPAGAEVLIGPELKDAGSIWGVFKNGAAGDGCPWTLEPGGVLRCKPKSGDIATRKKYGDCHFHVEFNLTFEPANRSQGRSNSGVFTQERYELQVLDSYGLKGVFNETGALYRFKAPLVNACLPPGMWQTYDVDFIAAKADGANMKPAHFTVLLNGLTVQKDTEIPHCTGARIKRTVTAESGPFLLQDHGHAVAFRNMWVLETH